MSVGLFVIPDAKIRDYLLNLSHRDGGSKAKFFLAKGFAIDRPTELAVALGNHTNGSWPGKTITTAYGVKHIIVAPMLCPDGTSPLILAIWQDSLDGAFTSFVTARPHK